VATQFVDHVHADLRSHPSHVVLLRRLGCVHANVAIEYRLRKQLAEGVCVAEGMPLELALRVLIAAKVVKPPPE
jgi:hypothetical protein